MTLLREIITTEKDSPNLDAFGRKRISETGILTIAAVRTTGTSASVLTALKWIEIR